jgi:hypothetical protein
MPTMGIANMVRGGPRRGWGSTGERCGSCFRRLQAQFLRELALHISIDRDLQRCHHGIRLPFGGWTALLHA